MNLDPSDWITDSADRWDRIPVICHHCGDDDTGPWVPLNNGRFLCEACWEKRTT